MKAPCLTDRMVKVTAYLSDEGFGYENWHAAQFAAPREIPTRPALLIICASDEERRTLFHVAAAYLAASLAQQT